MNMSVRERIALLLKDDRRRMQALGILVILALVVSINVGLVLRRRGLAKTQEVRVLDCPFSGVAAHTHEPECYDADGNLVCPLPERELHTHTDDCYHEDRRLICGQEESENHQHTDDCYEIERILVCGREEISETHVHGEGCFKTIRVELGTDEAQEEIATAATDPSDPEREWELATAPTSDGEHFVIEIGGDVPDEVTADQGDTESATDQAQDAASDGGAEATEEAPHKPTHLITADGELVREETTDSGLAYDPDNRPAQRFVEKLRDADNKVVLTVTVEAPEGALPQGVTMVVAPVEPSDVEAAVESAVAQKTSGKVGELLSVDITFLDPEGNEVEPDGQLMVSLSSDLVKNNDGLMVVHVDAEGSGEVLDALSDEELAARNHATKTDTITFDTKN